MRAKSIESAEGTNIKLRMKLCSRRIALLAILLELKHTCDAAYHLPQHYDPLQHGVLRAAGSSVRPAATTTTSEPGPDTFEGEEEEDPESNFWYSVIRKDNPDDNNSGMLPPVPTVPTLDRDGPLPPAAYVKLGNPLNDLKDICRLSVALNLLKRNSGPDEQLIETSDMIRSMQGFIDSGLTSFQIKSSPKYLKSWAEENVYGRLRRETPASVMERCQLTVPLFTPPKESVGVVSAISIRETFLESLSRIGGDSLDNVQLQYQQGSPYHLDVLDCVEDMKREGLVRSVSGRNLPNELLRLADSCGFHLDSNQIDFNLLDTTAYDMERRLTCDDLNTPLLVSSPLAGGLLTRCGLKHEPNTWQLRPEEAFHIKETLPKWAERHGGASSSPSSVWSSFQSILMETLRDIALKHRVSVGSVNLRWSLQHEHIAGSVVTCRLCQKEGDSGRPRKPRSQELREVFTFDLDEEDMTRLWESSNTPPSSDEPDADDFRREMFEEENGFFQTPQNEEHSPIDFSKRKLWL